MIFLSINVFQILTAGVLVAAIYIMPLRHCIKIGQACCLAWHCFCFR